VTQGPTDSEYARGIAAIGARAPSPIPMAFDGFGGWKRSLFGEMAVHGMAGVRFSTPASKP